MCEGIDLKGIISIIFTLQKNESDISCFLCNIIPFKFINKTIAKIIESIY